MNGRFRHWRESRPNLSAAQAEYQALLPARERYNREKGTFDPALEQHLACVEGVRAAGKLITYLNEARSWMQQDAIYRNVSEDNRKLEFLSLAEEQAARLTECTARLPEGTLSIGNYLRHPEGYITGVTSKFGQLDKLNLAIEQVVTLRDQLKALL